MNSQFIRRETFFQVNDQIPVQFDHVHLRQMQEQAFRHGSHSGTDFQHVIRWLRSYCRNDIIQNGLVFQKILSESFAGNMFHILKMNVSPVACHEGGRVDGFNHTAMIGQTQAFFSDIQSGTMIDRRSDNGKP